MEFPKIEKKILKFWEKNKIFEKSISQRKGKPIFSFYDGPPFASGSPHYGHILTSTIKDAVLRYFAMQGYQVPRRVGWDCHGLPVENLIEKELGIKNKREIENFGIEKFNLACKESVFRYVKEWVATLKRLGRWADYKNAYATMDKKYTESVWWVFKKIYQLGLIYKDFRVCPYCPRCGTPLSNFEVNQPGAYRDIEDQSVYLKFPLKEEKNTYFLVWTTTPWTLPGNVAVAVNPEFTYLKVKVDNEYLILAKERMAHCQLRGEVISQFKGKDLVGLEYSPLYENIQCQKANVKCYKIVSADFVSLEEGTGLVHIAPAFGEEDMELGKKENLPVIITVDEEGKIKTGLNLPGQGLFVKIADEEIKKDLKERNLLYKEEKIVHSYPFCWRCDTPLLYYPIESWYVAVSKIKKQLIENNKKIHWVPEHIKEGRFGKWLEGARDWAISRNRFWGAPLPVWLCQTGKSEILNPKSKINSKSKILNSKPCGNIQVIGSIKELEKLSGKKIKDLHRPYIDEITLKCEQCGGIMKRIPEVFDCWFESGSMPYAQWHYPFENKKLVEKTFPADFIVEGLDQTRGWFYTLHVLATILSLKNLGLGINKPAFKNVIVNGLILAEDGKKLSKRLKNYTPPEIIFEKFGADTLRYFLLTSSQIGEDYLVSDRKIEEVWRKTISTFWHCFLFFQTYKDKNFKPKNNFKPKTFLDKWIISRLNSLIKEVTLAMKDYQLTNGARPIDRFIDELSNWYIRRSRRKFQKPENKTEKEQASQTLYYVLCNLAKISAPFVPFLSEEIYQSLKKKSDPFSVHLCDYPKFNQKLINKKLEEEMKETREVASLALAERIKFKIKVRQPLKELQISNYQLKNKKELLDLIKEEVNVKNISFGKELKLETKITPELKEEGIVKEIVRHLQEARKKLGFKPKDKIYVFYSGENDLNKIISRRKEFILKEVLAKDVILGKKEHLIIEATLKIDGKNLWLGIKK